MKATVTIKLCREWPSLKIKNPNDLSRKFEGSEATWKKITCIFLSNDLNSCDALFHSCTKRRLRQFPPPLCQSHIQRDWGRAVSEVSEDGRLIQRSFWRAFRRDAAGDIDNALIPDSLLAWYEDSDDEEETVEGVESDVEAEY